MTPNPPISQKVLFVDDEKLLLEGIKRQLRREFDISVAESGAEALAIIEEQGPFAVVVSDYNMPKMDGVQFLNAVYQSQPQTVLVMLTGRAELDLAVDALHHAHISRFLNKPCPKPILHDVLTDGLEQYRLRRSEQLLQEQLQQANRELNELNGRLEILVTQKTRALNLQYRHVARLAKLTHSQAVIDTLIAAVKELTQIDAVSLWLSPQLNNRFSRYYPKSAEDAALNIADCDSGLIADILATRTIWRNDSSSQRLLSASDEQLFSGPPLLSVPLQHKTGLLGLLNVAGDQVEISKDILEALTAIVDVTSTALQSHWHREAFEQAQDAIITSLAKLSEYRDPETGAHLLRLKKYCQLLCAELAKDTAYQDQVTAEFTADLIRSSPLHDIGKVGIPDAILKKPGKLTFEEFLVMKDHAKIGGDTLRTVFEQYPTQSFIKCGMDVAYCHHEKWDGSGYPQGLKGESIPLAARILALADVYDALTCRRVYKEPFSRDSANAVILQGRGNHFDPDIVSAFQRIETDFYRIAEQFADIV